MRQSGEGGHHNPKSSISFAASKKETWCDIAKGTNSKENSKNKLHFIDSTDVMDLKDALIKEDAIKKGGEEWKNSIMAYILGPRPYYVHFKAFLIRFFKFKGELEIFSKANAFYIITFRLEEDCGKPLEGGPYFFDGRIMVMKNGVRRLKQIEICSLPVYG